MSQATVVLALGYGDCVIHKHESLSPDGNRLLIAMAGATRRELATFPLARWTFYPEDMVFKWGEDVIPYL